MNGKTVRSSDHGVLFYNVFAASPILPPPPSKKKKKKCQKRAVTGVKRGSLHTASKTDCRTKPEGIFEGLGDSSSCMNDINIFVFPGWLLNYDLHL